MRHPPDKRSGPEVTTPQSRSNVESPPSNQDADCIVARRWRPSTYSLASWELAAHIRDLRRLGWQGWEIRARFDTEWAA